MAEEKNMLERHFQSALSVIIVGLITWMGLTAMDSSKQIAVMNERVAGLSKQLDALKESMADRYTGAEGRRLEKRLDTIEQRFGSHILLRAHRQHEHP